MKLRFIEETSLKAWPALEQDFYDGWILRFSKGYSKRANSVNALYLSTLDVSKKVDYCEKAYKERGLPPIFRVTPFFSPHNLDQFLDNRGYKRIDPTWVFTLELAHHPISPNPKVEFQPLNLDEWIEIFCRFREEEIEKHLTHIEILKSIPTPKVFAGLLSEGEYVACGIGTIVEHNFGLFDLITDPAQRRQGHGTDLVMSMLSWAKEKEARLAFLQVVERNFPAFNLYKNFGFTKTYPYWYRIKK
jgi:GNAT superfamily N-acetyltransferase